MTDTKPKAIVLGGSAGSIKLVTYFLKNLSASFSTPLIMALHRANEPNSNLRNFFQEMVNKPLIEPLEPTLIEEGNIYLAPPGLHIVVEPNYMLNVDNSPLVHYSKPSIDVLFISAAEAFKEQLTGILVSGSNDDGALGIKSISERGGFTIVQDPEEATLSRMPMSAIRLTKVNYIFNAAQILAYLNQFE